MDRDQAYQAQAEAQINELRARLELLRAKAERAAADKNVEYREKLDELRDSHQELLERAEAARNRGSEAWEELKKGALGASQQLKSAVERAVSRFER